MLFYKKKCSPNTTLQSIITRSRKSTVEHWCDVTHIVSRVSEPEENSLWLIAEKVKEYDQHSDDV